MAQGDLIKSYISALSIVDDVIVSNSLNDRRPSLLHHYTSLEIGQKILTSGAIRLNHCEYSNDSDEIVRSIELVRSTIEDLSSHASTFKNQRDFYDNVLLSFDTRASTYEAFVFCMSEGDSSRHISQDVLSLWRAYGRDGRGICLSFESYGFDITNAQSSFRLSRVMYDIFLQEKVVRNILDKGWKKFSASTPKEAHESITATVVALMFFLPTMKNEAFSDEREWRFIYVPEPQEVYHMKRHFHARSDGLLVPYFTYGRIEDTKIFGKIQTVLPHISEIMVGPSPYQELSLRALDHIRGQATPRASSIPYRSQIS